jgi:hypothetical protein
MQPTAQAVGKQAKESASSEGAKETCLTRLAILSFDWVFSKVPHGLRRGPDILSPLPGYWPRSSAIVRHQQSPFSTALNALFVTNDLH